MRLTHLLLVAAPVFATDDGWLDRTPFDTMARRVENHFGASRARIPFIGLAGFFSGFARPVGARGLKLAIFENVNGQGRGDFSPNIDSSWKPVIRVHSNRNADDVYIYARPDGGWTRMLMLTVSRHDAVLAEMSFKPNYCAEFISGFRK